MTKNKFLILLGIGNTIRMDDGAGIRVVENLEKDSSLVKLSISFKYLNTGGIDVLDAINGFKHAIIVDAASITDPMLNPGEFFHIKDLSKLNINYLDHGISSHSIGVLPVLRLTKISDYDLPSKIEIFGIQVKETGFFSEDLTPEVSIGVERLVNILKKYIIELFYDKK